MADTINSDITALRAEVARLSKIISAQSAQAYSDVRDRAGDAYEVAVPQAKKAVAQVKAEGTAIAEVAREHPAAAGSVVIFAAAIGVGLGYLLGLSAQPEPVSRRYWR
ncbi:hypothetical protein [Pararhizobium sp.]|uniref:hypothetical protein n=1 Tax=Pararhizobium sp. TaxID=1977563 RepID=UPI0027272AED|nr:hypothetical protein [Pararhizobium sp.]MDO9415992.1 hypothetical protein [Pararhizobium sp.]